ncbi:asparagine synthase (glutamine-hydrolyzing) [Sulfurimonas sp. HSL1-2]|uniref:asparagine synthase (glutamine-hydrolyzing) n=1 Tax=Thiomicrolovo zhangzhouensis TaxID=3131933 RepID=UPI0031F7ED74
MCGVAGFIDHRGHSSEAVLKSMTDAMVLRGPDDSGTSFERTDFAQIGLGHRRLSILDLSALGHQPMFFEHLSMVYNGEVYNFGEIKSELETLGYAFASHSDTEVILKAFHAWGKECVGRFRGMFAFVIYDSRAEKLFMFRDRAGVKPFYYYVKDGLFLFASELKAFREHERFEKTIERSVIPVYMRFGYIPAPYTIFENTYKLKAGHYLEYDLQAGQFEIRQYWNVNVFYSKAKLDLSEEAVLDTLEQELMEAFQLRMVSDVPVGVFLSGGVDSSLVTALLQKASKEPLRTFTIGFDEEGYDEAEHARKIAAYLGTEHTEYYCTKEDALQVIPELPKIYDEPFGDSSAIATILVSKLAKEKVSVVLSGDGGDELFCGYSKYFALNRVMRLLVPGVKKNVLKGAVNLLNEKAVYRLNGMLPRSKRQTNIRDKFQKFKRAVNADTLEQMFIEASSYVDAETIENCLGGEAGLPAQTGFGSFETLADIAPLERMMAVDFQTFMVDDVLTKVDRATMSVSLEGREPLLDHKVAEFIARVPIALKYKDDSGKYLLKKVLYNHIPKSFFERQKSGFQVPLYEWLKNDLRPLLDRYLAKERLEEGQIFDAIQVQKTLEDYYEGRYVNINEIWFILMFEMWCETWGSMTIGKD